MSLAGLLKNVWSYCNQNAPLLLALLNFSVFLLPLLVFQSVILSKWPSWFPFITRNAYIKIVWRCPRVAWSGKRPGLSFFKKLIPIVIGALSVTPMGPWLVTKVLLEGQVVIQGLQIAIIGTVTRSVLNEYYKARSTKPADQRPKPKAQIPKSILIWSLGIGFWDFRFDLWMSSSLQPLK